MTNRSPAAGWLHGVRVHRLSRTELLARLGEWIQAGEPHKVYYVNVHAMNLAHRDPRLTNSLNSADLVFCDGFGVWLAARLAGIRLPERMTPPDWIDDLLALAARREKSVFLLGDEPGVVESCAACMRECHPGLEIAGTQHGFFDTRGEQNADLVGRIQRSGAAVLLVGMGMPRQEFWIDANLSQLNVSVAISVGALFRWYAGVERRAPRWVTDHGLEWLARWVRHPVRHFQRYLIGNPRFFLRALADRLTRMF